MIDAKHRESLKKDLRRHVRRLMVDLDETPKEALESLWCNARDDKPSEYFSGQPLGNCTLTEIEGLIEDIEHEIGDSTELPKEARKEPLLRLKVYEKDSSIQVRVQRIANGFLVKGGQPDGPRYFADLREAIGALGLGMVHAFEEEGLLD
jgi:hypothetical protein